MNRCANGHPRRYSNCVACQSMGLTRAERVRVLIGATLSVLCWFGGWWWSGFALGDWFAGTLAVFLGLIFLGGGTIAIGHWLDGGKEVEEARKLLSGKRERAQGQLSEPDQLNAILSLLEEPERKKNIKSCPF